MFLEPLVEGLLECARRKLQDKPQGRLNLSIKSNIPNFFCRIVKTAVEPIRQIETACVAIAEVGGAFLVRKKPGR